MTVNELELRLFGTTLAVWKSRFFYRRSLEKGWSLIESDYGNPTLSLSVMARHCGISKNHLNVILNQETGYSFHEILSRYRLLQAAKMMLNRDYTFLEIALETGFGNTYSLERQVRRILGFSPKQMRHLLRATAHTSRTDFSTDQGI